MDTFIVVKSAANEKQLQSEEVDIAILSEAARLPEIVWTKYLSTRTGRSIWPTTPDAEAAWIWREIEKGKADPRLRLDHFQFTPRANPKFKYDRYWIEHAKAETRVDAARAPITPVNTEAAPSKTNGHDCFDEATQCVAMKDAGFAEQFGGLWTFHRGRVVPIRKEESRKGEVPHVINEDRPWFEWADVHVSMDYGFADGVCVLFWLIGPRQVVLRQSIYDKGIIPDDLVKQTKNVIEEMGWKNRVTRFVGDPKKPEVVELFRRRGLPIWDVDKKAQADRKAGHLELMNYLSIDQATGEPHMLIHKDNVSVIDEWMNLRYKDPEKTRNLDTEGALAGKDHAYDAARYFVMARPPIEMKQETRLADLEFSKLRQQILRGRNRRPQRTVPRGSGHSWAGGISA